MSNLETSPAPATPKYLEWLNKEQYQLETSVPAEGNNVTWTRKTKYGARKCSTNGDVIVAITKVGNTFSMGLRGSTPNYWGATEVYNMSEDFLVARGRQVEHRLVDAWRELVA